MQPDPDLQGRLPVGDAFGIELLELQLHLDGGVDRARRVVRPAHRGAPQAHQGVSDELVEDAAVLEEDVDHQLEIVVEHLDHFLRGQLLAHRGEAADVAEEDGQLGELAALRQLQRAARRLLHQRGGKEAR